MLVAARFSMRRPNRRQMLYSDAAAAAVFTRLLLLVRWNYRCIVLFEGTDPVTGGSGGGGGVFTGLLTRTHLMAMDRNVGL